MKSLLNRNEKLVQLYMAFIVALFFILSLFNLISSPTILLFLFFLAFLPVFLFFWNKMMFIGIYFLLIFSVFFNFRYRFEGLFSNLSFAIIMVFLVGIAFLFRSVLEKHGKIFFDPVSKYFVLFLGISLLSVLVNPQRFSFKDNMFAMMIYFASFVIYLVVNNFVKSLPIIDKKNFLRNSLFFSFVSACILSFIIIFLFYSGGKDLVKGSDVVTVFGGGGPLGCYFMLMLSFLFAFLFGNVSSKKKLIIVFALILLFSGLVLAFSRSAIIGTGLSFVIISFLLAKRKNAIMIILVSLVILLFPFLFKFSSVFGADTISQTFNRIVIWQDSFSILENNLWGGIGPGNYTYYSRFFLKGAYVQSPHNNYLRIAVESGVFGLFAFLLLLFSGFRRSLLSFKFAEDYNLKVFSAGFIGAFAGFLFAAFFGDFILPAKENLGYLSFGFVVYFWIYFACVNALAVKRT